MSETYPQRNHCETPFAGHIPSSVGFGCKDTTKFAFLQIFEVKSDCDKDLNKNTGSVSPIKINKNQGDTWRARQG